MKYTLQKIIYFLALVLIAGGLAYGIKYIFSLNKAEAAWYATGGNWGYRKTITINHIKVPNTNQTDFPVLIDVTDSNLATNAQSDGDDILFTSSDGSTKLNHEIETYTSSTGRLTAWVKVPTLST